MKKLTRVSLIFAFATILFLWTLASAQALTVHFNDDNIIWPGWETQRAGYLGDNTEDVIWNPNIVGGSVNIDNNRLASIEIEFESWGGGASPNLWNFLRPGDLFIDLGADGYWNYAFNFWDHTIKDQDNYQYWYGELPGNDIAAEHVYQIDAPLPILGPGTGTLAPDSGYLESNWTNGRFDHPIAFNPSSQIAYTDILDSNNLPRLLGWGSTIITFSNLNLDLSGISEITIGWTQNCANDVLLQSMVIPEPGTLLLLGIGLAGLLAVRRRMTAH
ncbi:PEP-CTERM sorting domain-containing protein [Desulfonatronum thiodismutans]|uniref:PEP-CTERM sorting domain-containing protein n=1 Tax=Desulfonatronum thiodismutans TaxID=159290 RepID=UPI0004ABE70E|nr:PEP-CTERM sorting domain-containing protein [Desulfonatronum thiodismutans]